MHKTSKCTINAVQSAFPAQSVEQNKLTQLLKDEWAKSNINPSVVGRLHQSVLVSKRHISLPINEYLGEHSFEERNHTYINVSLDLAEQAVNNLLEKTNTAPQDISQIIFTTVTGIAVPSIDARLMNKIAFSPNLKRVPIFGLGCVAGAAGIARAADYLAGHPNDLVILLAIELCSLTFQKTDQSVANIIACGLFGDGAAAVLLSGSARNAPLLLPKVIDSCSFFFPDSEGVMGWDINNHGFKIVLNADVPKIAAEKIPVCIDKVLAKHHINRNDIAAWIAHPGGPRVIQALIDGLKLPPHALQASYDTLAELGNLSSVSVLMILEKTMKNKQFRSGDYGVLFAMGPGFCAEVVLLQW